MSDAFLTSVSPARPAQLTMALELEAAEKDVEDRPAPKSKRQIGLELAIAALYRRAGEVMG